MPNPSKYYYLINIAQFPIEVQSFKLQSTNMSEDTLHSEGIVLQEHNDSTKQHGTYCAAQEEANQIP